MALSFKKEERLCSRVTIEQLYADGHRLMVFPYSVQWMFVERPASVTHHPDHPCQVLIVAPKRKFKHAVDRNRVKRLTRECFRLRKDLLYNFLDEHGISIVFSMVYVHNEILTFDQLGHKMDKLLTALQHDIAKTLPS